MMWYCVVSCGVVTSLFNLVQCVCFDHNFWLYLLIRGQKKFKLGKSRLFYNIHEVLFSHIWS